MAYSLYDGSIVTAKMALQSLDNMLVEAEKLPDANEFLTARLTDDMNDLRFQIFLACLMTDSMIKRLAGQDISVPFGEYDEAEVDTYEKMHSRIAQVIARLDQADKDFVNKAGEEVAPTQLATFGEFPLAGKQLAYGVVIPNIFFHINMAYAILRKEGVSLGKMDYMKPFAATVLEMEA